LILTKRRLWFWYINIVVVAAFSFNSLSNYFFIYLVEQNKTTIFLKLFFLQSKYYHLNHIFHLNKNMALIRTFAVHVFLFVIVYLKIEKCYTNEVQYIYHRWKIHKIIYIFYFSTKLKYVIHMYLPMLQRLSTG
jgi:hypothetical protein